MSSSAATQLVHELEEQELLLRETDAHDKRVIRITLSEKAQEQFARMTSEKIRAFSIFFDVLDDSEFAQYVAFNKKIISHIQSF